MSNSQGGTVFIGVTDDREVVGRARDQGTDDAIHEAALAARNVGSYRITSVSVDGTNVVAVEVEPRSDEVAQTSDGRVLVRRGGRNVAIFGGDLWTLMSTRALRRYEHSDSGVSADLLDPSAAENLSRAFGWRPGEEREDRLRERNLLHSSGRLTVAGALTLSDPTASMRTAKFVVDLRSYESDSSSSYIRREVMGGPVQQQAERATSWVLRDIGTELVVTDAIRHDVPRLPPRVVREAIANAVAHRDYASDRTPIVVEVRPSGVRVTSPGRLPAPVTVTTLREAQSPRNHTVIEVLRRLGLAEDSGQGIDIMQDGMRLELLEEPVFEESADSFSVYLPLKGLITPTERGWLAEHERTGALRAEERPLLLSAMREGQLTNATARDILGIDSVVARATLRRLRDVGLLLQHGTRGRAYYELGVIGPDRTPEQVVLDEADRRALTNRTVREITGLERAPALALLKRLVQEGRLTQHGQRRGTYYERPKR